MLRLSVLTLHHGFISSHVMSCFGCFLHAMRSHARIQSLHVCVRRYVWLNEFSGQLLPILALIVLRGVVGVGQYLIKRFGKKKKDKMQEMADEYGRHRAAEFNVGQGGNRRDTGVRYADVAGIDAVKSDIEETMRMILGSPEFDAIGARPPRVLTPTVIHMSSVMPVVQHTASDITTCNLSFPPRSDHHVLCKACLCCLVS